jgi:hypothetical protein
MSSCPVACVGGGTHAERQGDDQRFYCSEHALWRAREVGRQHVRVLRADELTDEAAAGSTASAAPQSR